MQPKHVRSFSRGLAVLEALNHHGSATALALARTTNVPRVTVYRLLQTLQEAGYVERGVGDDRFHLKSKVRRLAEGFEDEQWIAEIARPMMVALTKRLSWPCDVLTFHGLRMVIRDTTHPVAPFSIDRNMVGREIPLLESAAGLAYLAFTPPPERAQILELLATSNDAPNHRPWDLRAAERVLTTTLRQGFGLRQGGLVWPHTGAIALPLRHNTRVLGCISIIWMAKVIGVQDGIQRCLGPLTDARAAIERDMAFAEPTA